MKRNICVILIFFMAGILVGYFIKSFLYVTLSILLSIVVSIFLYKKYNYAYLIFMPLIVILGCIRTIDSISPSEYIFDKFADNKSYVEISAVIYNINEYENNYTFLAESDYIKKDDTKLEKSIGIKVTTDKIKKISIGDRVKLSGDISHLNTIRNPGGSNEKFYYNLRNIEYKIYAQNIEILGKENNIKIILAKLNSKIANVYDNIFPKEEASIIKAMIIGDKTDISSQTKDLFRKTGIYHIIVISGLHIHILAYIILFFAEKYHKRYGKLLAVLFIILYCVFTGASVASIRATCMFLIYIIGKFIYRESDTLNSLAVSCLLILIFKPLYLYDAGFQYSFCAVLSLIIFTKPIASIINRKIDTEKSEIIASAISVQFISKVVVWFNFYAFPTLDILANLIVLPFTGIIVFLGFIIGVVGIFCIKVSAFFSGIVYLILRFYEIVCNIITDIPFCYIIAGKPNIISLFSYLLIICVLAFYLYKYVKLKFLIIFMVCIIFANSIFSISSDLFKVTILDVGQGDCFVMNYNNRCFVVDGGGNYNIDLNNDTGYNVLFPYLKYMGISHIDAIFVTHFDVDHIKGIIEILSYDDIDIDSVYVSGTDNENDLYNTLCEIAHNKDIPISVISSKNSFNFEDIYINCLYPLENTKYKGNESSLVLKVSFKNTSFLFTGDIDKECEKEIINSENDIKADILKLAHHGSKNSNSEEFIEKVNPKLAVVSAGSFNRYGHPAKEVINILKQKNINILNTNDNGAIELYSDGEEIFFTVIK